MNNFGRLPMRITCGATRRNYLDAALNWKANHTEREIFEMQVLDHSYLAKDTPEQRERRLASNLRAFDELRKNVI